MNASQMYKEKLRTPEEAVRLIEPGDDMIVPLAVGEPPALLDALVGHTGLRGNRLFQMLTLRPYLKVDPEKIKLISTFLGAGDREGYQSGAVDLLPNHFSEVPRLLRDFTANRVILATVSQMDQNGYFSLGTNADFTCTLLDDAKLILLEVNQNMPRTFGKNQIHISQVSALTENHVPLPALPEPILSDTDVTIGRYVAELIHDGDTVQIGIGGIPNATMNFLKDHKDLGIFTEMLPDKVIDLYEAGVVTNRNKPIYEGLTTMAFALGSKRLYDFMHENPDLYMIPVNESNDVRVISQFDNIVSINTTIEIDFMGQCNSETVGPRYYSSTGGQADFAKGVRLAGNGRGIICLQSTAKGGTISKVVPVLSPNAVVTTSKNDVDYVVTEFGVARLKGKTIRERTQAVINIAHPKFREELSFQAKQMGYLI